MGNSEMKLHEAERKLNEIANIKFKDLFTAEELQTIIVNKGKTGQLFRISFRGCNYPTQIEILRMEN